MAGKVEDGAQIGVFGHLDDTTQRALLEAGYQIHRVESVSSLRSSLPEAVLVGSDEQAPIRVAQEVARLDSSIPVVILTEEPEVLRKQLMISPFIGASVRVIARDDSYLTKVLSESITAADARRHYVETIGEIDRALQSSGAPANLAGSYLGPLLDFAPLGVLLVNPDGVVLAANPYAESIAPMLSAPMNMKVETIFEGQDEAVQELLAASASPVGPILLELRASEGIRYIEVSSAPVHEISGRRLLLLLHDVTARMEAERQMKMAQESLSFQKSLLESQSDAMVDGVLVVGSDGSMISFNRRFIEMWEMPQEVVESRSDEAAIRFVVDRLEDPEGFLERVSYLYEHPYESSRDEVVLKDGRVFDRYSAPVVGEGNQLFGRMWFFHDVTEAKRRERTLALLAAATEAASATRNVAENLRRIGELVVKNVADICIFYLQRDDGAISRVELIHRDPEVEEGIRRAVNPFVLDIDSSSGVVQVIREGKPLLATHADAEMMAADVTDPSRLFEILRPLGITSWMCVPLTAQDHTIGAMSVVSVNPNRKFHQADLELGLELGRRVTLGVESVRVAEQERRIAETLQRSLLPQTLPRIPGLEVASRYVAGSQGMDVGGDWFEVMQLPDKKVLAVIGDVAGKGLRAAAIMGEIRTALRAYSLQTSAPAELVNRLNRLIMSSENVPMATLVCAVLDLREYRMKMVSAGHLPPILLLADGEARRLQGGLRPPLGTMLEPELEAEYEFPPGATLLLYTDGVVERRDRPIDESIDNLVGRVTRASQDLEKLCDEVLGDPELSGESIDDAAVLAIKFSAMHEPFLSLRHPAEPQQLGKIRDAVERWLLPLGLDPEVISDVVFSVNEASANAIEHAYGPARGSFSVDARIVEEEVLIEVIDEGSWRDPVRSDQGRGLGLIRHFMDDVSIDRSPDGTRIVMRKDLRKSASNEVTVTERVQPTEEAQTEAYIALDGDLDLARVPLVRQLVLSRITNETRRLVLDLTRVSYLDSSGIRLLFRLADELRSRRQEFTVVVPPDSRIRKLLDVTGVSGAMELVDRAT